MGQLSTCRCCKNFYRRTSNSENLDGCCSGECFRTVGPYVTTNINGVLPTKFKPKTPAERKSRREAKRKHRELTKDQFYRTPQWLELRYDVLRKYGRSCMLCGTKKGAMHVDHIEPKSRRPELALTFSNMQVLCQDCNMGKSNRDSTDFRPANKVLTPS